MLQLSLFDTPEKINLAVPDLTSYQKILVMMSGGKDSLACLLHLLEQGVDPSIIELWHHDIDGREGSTLMDWPITRSYCEALAKAFNIPLYFSWKVGGFEREMNKNNAITAPTKFETPDGIGKSGGTTGKPGTRLMFPQVSRDLRVRWCSPYLKIAVCSVAINNQTRFLNSRTLVVTGERALESPGRAKYKTFEPHTTNSPSPRLRRHVDHWRPVHAWGEEEVWAIIEKYRVNPHPAYHLGFGRVSCMTCIFASENQWATVKRIAHKKFYAISDYEIKYGKTIDRDMSVRKQAGLGTVFGSITDEMVALALSTNYTAPIFIDNWKLPGGAFGESCGPT